jgi:hypothetical protein
MASGINVNIVSKFDAKGINQAKGGLTGLQKGLKNFGKVMGGFAIASTAAFAAFGVSSLKAAADAQKVSGALQQMARNSGVFGDQAIAIKTATDALMDHSTQMAKLTGIDDEAYNSLKSTWLGVPAIAATGTEGLNNLATVAADVAVGAGKDLTTIGTLFTKAFSNPTTALTKFQKAGIVFNQTQQDTYNNLLATSGAASAQAYLVEQLGTKYAGAAQAAASPFERLKFVMEDLQETVGAALLPAFNQLVTSLSPIIERIGPVLADIFGKLAPVFDTLAPVIDQLLTAFEPLWGILGDLFAFIADVIVQVMPIFTSLMEMLMPVIEKLLPPLMDLLKAVLEPLIPIVLALIDALSPLIDAVLPVFVEIVNMLSPILGELVTALLTPLVEVFKVLMPVITPIIVILLKLLQLALKPIMVVLELILPLFSTKMPDAFNIATPIISGMADVLNTLVGWLTQAVDWVTQLFDGLMAFLGLDGKSVNVSSNVTAYNSDGSVDHDHNPATHAAKGGIFPARAGGWNVNLAEAGKSEAVIPLDRMGAMSGASAGGGTNVTINVTAGVGDPVSIGREVVTAIKRYERASGKVFASA